MTELIVKGGYVFDPINNIENEKMDVLIKDGKVVDKVDESKAKIVNVSGMTVFPGGIDIHTHHVSAKMNLGRMIQPEDHRRDPVAYTSLTRAGSGFSCPTTFVTGYRYAVMGYTMAVDPAISHFAARHVHEELWDTPMLDHAVFPCMGDHWVVLDAIRNKERDTLKAYIAWLMEQVKGYAIKIVNPGGVESWGFGKTVSSLDETIEHFEVSPRQILLSLAEANEELGMPHPIHVHCTNLGRPGSAGFTLETMKALSAVKPRTTRKETVHITHIQFNGFGGEDWSTFQSGMPELAEYINSHSHVTVDVGQIIFGCTTTMTSDGAWEYLLYTLTKAKWVNKDGEAGEGGGIVPYTYKPKNMINAIMWATGLEASLLINDPWRVFMTTDNPNGGPFYYYPDVITWLMSKAARDSIIKRCHKKIKTRTSLLDIEREYTLQEIAITTRAGPAKSLGLVNKGHLGVGADADVSVYDIDPNTDLSNSPHLIQNAFSTAAYTIKDGNILVKDGQIASTPRGATYWVQHSLSPGLKRHINDTMTEYFDKYLTMQMSNFTVKTSELHEPKPLSLEAP
ncbi:MAG: formylmethanofuran dehydrogenase subunit A [Candidatus Ranarchaeia archaeon]